MVRTASKAIIIQESKILVIKKEDEIGPFYILPADKSMARTFLKI